MGPPPSQSSQRSDEFHKLVVSGAAPETATILRSLSFGSASHFSPPRSSLRISFVKTAGRDSDQAHLGHPIRNAWEAHSCRGSTDWRLHFRSRSPRAETRRRGRRQCRCNPCREHHLRYLLERGCVEDQPQPCENETPLRIASAATLATLLRLAFSTVALRTFRQCTISGLQALK